MAIKVPNTGEITLLKLMTGVLTGGTWIFRLYQNNITPGDSDVLGTYTEATFSGYTEVTITWATIVTNSTTGKAEAIGPVNPQFDHDGGGTSNNIYGYYVIYDDTVTEHLCYSERFSDAPRVMDTNDDSIVVPCFLTLRSEV